MGDYTINPKDGWSVLDALVGIILAHRKGPIVEIGSAYGRAVTHVRTSAHVLMDHAERFGVEYYTCDIRKNTVTDYSKHTHYTMPSFDFMKEFAQLKKQPSVVFLDGCHDYDVVIEEVKFFLNIMKFGGVLFMHDTYPAKEFHLEKGQCSDSYKVRQEVEGWRNIVDCFTWPYTAGNVGLTMVIKKMEDRPFFRE